MPKQAIYPNPHGVRHAFPRVDLRSAALAQARAELQPWLDLIDREKIARLQSFIENEEPHCRPALKELNPKQPEQGYQPRKGNTASPSPPVTGEQPGAPDIRSPQ
jgi:hypothetical protein